MAAPYLPSYQEATHRPDPLLLVAPYIRLRDHAALCRVNKRFHDVFAPRLWHNPFRTARRLGLHPSDGDWHLPSASWSLDQFVHANKQGHRQDIRWLRRFMLSTVPNTRLSTRSLVRVIDFRGFAQDAFLLAASGGSLAHRDSNSSSSSDASPSLDALFRDVGAAFPSLRCVFLDAHPDLDPSAVASWTLPSPSPLVLLSFSASCRPASGGLFAATAAASLQSLVFLDVSCVPGSLRPLTAALAAGRFPCLRILKARGRGLGGADGLDLVRALGAQAWSLDLSDNRLSDAVVAGIVKHSFAPVQVGGDGDDGDDSGGGNRGSDPGGFLVEGRLVGVPGLEGSDEWGARFTFIEESTWSGAFAHPQRFCVDAPPYSLPNETSSSQSWQQEAARWRGRSDALDPVRQDDAEAAQAALTVGNYGVQLGSDLVPTLDIASSHMGLTHLHLAGSGLTTRGLQRLVGLAPQLEHLDCDGTTFVSLPFSPSSSSSSSSSFSFSPFPDAPTTAVARRRHVHLVGIPDCVYLFRPLLSPNLRSLRVHHSLVTGVPTIAVGRQASGSNNKNSNSSSSSSSGGGNSPLSRLRLAESIAEDVVGVMFPLRWVPDANPRLESLTLTQVPRRSSGVLVERLVEFLKLAAIQEGERARWMVDSGGGGGVPGILRGLRRLKLEFEDEDATRSDDNDADEDRWGDALDAGTVMNTAGDEFSFFADETPPARTSAASPSSGKDRPRPCAACPCAAACPDDAQTRSPRSRIIEHPYDASSSSSSQEPFLAHSTTWNGGPVSLPVWIGTGVLGPSAAVNRYMARVCREKLRGGVGPVTPSQVAAGAPERVLVFHDAWAAGLLDDAERRVIPIPGRGAATAAAAAAAAAAPTKDVLAEIKTWRRQTKARYEAERKRKLWGDGMVEERGKSGDRVDGPARVKSDGPHFWWSGRLQVELKASVMEWR